MPWVKIDEHADEHRKQIEAGPEACWLWVRGLCWSARHLSDGWIPESVAQHLAWKQGLIENLVRVSLWRQAEGGYQINDYHKYQPTREEVESVRLIRREAGKLGGLAKAEARRKQPASNLLSNDVANDVAKLYPDPDPDPDPDPVEEQVRTPLTPQGGDDVAPTTEISRTKMGHAGASRFDRFWMAYPLKHGKGAAMRAWDKAKPTEQMTDLILAAIEQQKTWRKWREGFVPNPSTWLNQQRWLDEPEPARENPKSRSAGNREALERFIARRTQP